MLTSMRIKASHICKLRHASGSPNDFWTAFWELRNSVVSQPKDSWESSQTSNQFILKNQLAYAVSGCGSKDLGETVNGNLLLWGFLTFLSLPIKQNLSWALYFLALPFLRMLIWDGIIFKRLSATTVHCHGWKQQRKKHEGSANKLIQQLTFFFSNWLKKVPQSDKYMCKK